MHLFRLMPRQSCNVGKPLEYCLVATLEICFKLLQVSGACLETTAIYHNLNYTVHNVRLTAIETLDVLPEDFLAASACFWFHIH